MFLPGIVGLNNVNQNDGVNVVLQLLMAVKPLRDYVLQLRVSQALQTRGRAPPPPPLCPSFIQSIDSLTLLSRLFCIHSLALHAARRHGVTARQSVWRSHAARVEPEELQGTRVASRNATSAGRRSKRTSGLPL